jgi:excisionase family DNA binding protein
VGKEDDRMRLNSPDLLASHMARTHTDNRRLADMAGVTRQFIWALVRGREMNVSPETAAAIEDALDADPGELFDTPWLTATEVADLLRITPDQVRHWARTGKLAAANFGAGRAMWRFRPGDVHAFIQARARNAA